LLSKVYNDVFILPCAFSKQTGSNLKTKYVI